MEVLEQKRLLNTLRREKGTNIVVRKHSKLCSSFGSWSPNFRGFPNKRVFFPAHFLTFKHIRKQKRDIFFGGYLTLLVDMRPVISKLKHTPSRLATCYRPHVSLRSDTLDSPICQNKTSYFKIRSSNNSEGNRCKRGLCAEDYRLQSDLSITLGMNYLPGIPSGPPEDNVYRPAGFTGHRFALAPGGQTHMKSACVVRSCLTSGGKVQC